MYNILIVDDEKIERSGIRMLLKRMELSLEYLRRATESRHWNI